MMEERDYIYQLESENATLKNYKKVADITISELRKKLSKAEHDRDRYRRRIFRLEEGQSAFLVDEEAEND